MLKIKFKFDNQIHAIEFSNQSREQELKKLWKSNKNDSKEILIKTKKNETFKSKLCDIEMIIFDKINLVTLDDILGEMDDNYGSNSII